MRQSFLALFFTSAFMACVRAINPGLNAYLKIGAIDTIKDHSLPIIWQKTQNLPLGEVKFDIDYWIDTIHVTLNPVLCGLQIAPDLTTVEFFDQQIYFSTNGITFDMTSPIKIDSSFFSGSGNMTVSGWQNVVAFRANVVQNSTDPIQIQAAQVDFSNINIDVDGDLIVEILDAIFDVFQDDVIKALNGQLTNELLTQLQNASNTLLSMLNGTWDFRPKAALGLQYEPTIFPLIDPNHLEYLADGTFFNILKPYARPPITDPVALPAFDPASSSPDFVVYLTQYTINSLSYAAFDIGILQYFLKHEVSPDNMNVGFLAKVMPQLLERYTADQAIDLNFSADAIPSFNVSATTNLTDNLTVAIDIFVRLANGSSEKALTIVPTFIISEDFYITNNTVKVKLTDGQITALTIRNSLFPDIDPDKLRGELALLMKVALAQIQKLLDKWGYPLPSIINITITDPVIANFDGYIQISTSLQQAEAWDLPKKMPAWALSGMTPRELFKANLESKLQIHGRSTMFDKMNLRRHEEFEEEHHRHGKGHRRHHRDHHRRHHHNHHRH